MSPSHSASDTAAERDLSRTIRPATFAIGRLFVADVDDLVALHAAGGLDFDHLAGFLADQRARDRRANGDAARLDVGLVLANDLPGGVLAAGFDVHGGAEHAAAVGVHQFRIDDLGVAELRFKLGDASLDEAGPLASSVVLGILGKVAMGASLCDGG